MFEVTATRAQSQYLSQLFSRLPISYKKLIYPNSTHMSYIWCICQGCVSSFGIFCVLFYMLSRLSGNSPVFKTKKGWVTFPQESSFRKCFLFLYMKLSLFSKGTCSLNWGIVRYSCLLSIIVKLAMVEIERERERETHSKINFHGYVVQQQKVGLYFLFL